MTPQPNPIILILGPGYRDVGGKTTSLGKKREIPWKKQPIPIDRNQLRRDVVRQLLDGARERSEMIKTTRAMLAA
jgi:hypothetical protein